MEGPFELLPSTSVTIRIDPTGSVAPIREALTGIFDTEQVSVTEAPADQTAEVAAVRDGEVVATSPAESLMESLLLINSDTYITGSRALDEVVFPDVLQALHDIPFRLRGYPESNSEKLLLIVISRAIERRAIEAGAGTLRVGFQRLSRLVDESGTHRVYERLANTDLAIHAYGVGDTTLPAELDITTHTGTSRFHRTAWFVVLEPPTPDGDRVGLYALERDENDWEGVWSVRSNCIDAMLEVIIEFTTPQAR